MNPAKTYYHLIVDKSGSMMDCLDKTIQGFNEQMHKIQQIQLEHPDQQILTGLTTFNDVVHHHFFEATSQKPSYLSRENYSPSGSTALLDAIGQTSLLLEEKINSKNAINTTAVIVIITDGYENSSRMFNLEQVRSLIQRLEATGKWTFSFIGATLDAVDVASQMAIKTQNSYHFAKENMDDSVWNKLSGSLTNYMRKKSKGDALDNFIEEDK